MAKNEKVFIALAEIIADPKSYASYQDEYLRGPYWCNMHSDAVVKIERILESAGVGIKESFLNILEKCQKNLIPVVPLEVVQTPKNYFG